MASPAGKIQQITNPSQNTEARIAESNQCTTCNATHSMAHCQETQRYDHETRKAESDTEIDHGDPKDNPGWGEQTSPTPWNAPDTPTRWLSARDNGKELHSTHVPKLTISRLRYTMELRSHAARRY